MAISDLHLALIGAGAVGVVMVWAYNAWQDRQHRKTADRIFNGGQGDALSPESGIGDQEPGIRDRESGIGVRQEPRISDPASEIDESLVDENAAEPAATDAPPVEPEPVAQAVLPAEYADPVADCVLLLTAAEPIPAPALHAMQSAWSGELSKPLHWLAKDDGDASWQCILANETGRYREWAAALQLVDRRGPLSDGELARFFDGMQSVAQQTGAVLELPSRGELVMRAAALDEFCAGVDIQFVLHVVDATGGAFAGTKLRGVAEAAGLLLEGDGVFRARDANGGELFTVANLGVERLDAETLRSLATHGLTLSLDVPRVADGVAAFDRMLAVARQLTTALGGVLVDAQRAPLADAMIAAIRAKTGELQAQMNEAGILPGSTRALRLFS